MNWFKRIWRNLRNKLTSSPSINYREIELFKCKFCNTVFQHSLFKDMCQQCLRKGLEWSIHKSKEK